MRYLIAVAAITLSFCAGAERAEAALVTVTYTGTVASGVDGVGTFTQSSEPNNLAGLAYYLLCHCRRIRVAGAAFFLTHRVTHASSW